MLLYVQSRPDYKVIEADEFQSRGRFHKPMDVSSSGLLVCVMYIGLDASPWDPRTAAAETIHIFLLA